MATAVCISASFLTGRYHGEEWPPSPARLLQALVAGVKAGAHRGSWPEVAPALRWLESQPPPVILARPAKEVTPYRLAVPNNDFDTVARAWAAGRPANPADLRTMKMVSPRAVEAEEPHVRYIWSVPEGDDAVPDSLRQLADCLYSLGWGVDMAYARLDLEEPPADGYQEWAPAATGQLLKVPVSGFVDDLDATYKAFVTRTVTMNTDTRPSVYRLQRYEIRGVRGLPQALFKLREKDGLRDYHTGWHAGMRVAAWLRHGAAEAARRAQIGVDVDAFVLGHTEANLDRSHRLSFVPLPSIGHPHSDARIRRVMIVEPPTGGGEVVQRLEGLLRGATLTDDSGNVVCTLAPDDGHTVTNFYCRAARRWRSVTPVILHGYNASRGRISLPKTEALLRRAFQMAGFPTAAVESVAFQTAPLWAGAGAAAQVLVPGHLQNYPRYHVEVVFRTAVTGPVLAGIGRHYGIGVFAAADE